MNPIDAFSLLRAEDESWLEECFIPPVNFDLLATERSMIAFGGIGSGKTTLYEMLKKRDKREDGSFKHLLVDWRLHTPATDAGDNLRSVSYQVKQIFELCALQLAIHLNQYPDTYLQAAEYAQDRVKWFIQSYLPATPQIRLGRQFEQDSPGANLLRAMLAAPAPEILYAGAAPETIIDELCLALQPMHLDGIWIMADDIERMDPHEEKLVTNNLLGLLAALPLFERSLIAFKLFIPARIEGQIINASGVIRRRIDPQPIRWTSKELQRLVERRLQVSSGQTLTSLTQLYESPADLKAWLEFWGGGSPRYWLDQVYPLVKYYLANQCNQPLSKKIWHELRNEQPPRIFLDLETRRVTIGGREIEAITEKGFEMLAYLYARGNRIVSKEELYFLVYQGMERIPRTPEDVGFEDRTSYEGVVDTTIWRLRKLIELEPDKPILLETKRGHGLKLNMRW